MKTLAEVGEILQVTRERVRQIEAKALRKLRPPEYATKEWQSMESYEKLEVLLRHTDERKKRKENLK